MLKLSELIKSEWTQQITIRAFFSRRHLPAVDKVESKTELLLVSPSRKTDLMWVVIYPDLGL